MGKEKLYVDLTIDCAFKRIFKDEELMISFLNAVFEKQGTVITRVKYLDKEMTPRTKGERTAIFDLRCEVDDGKTIIVEMQRESQEYFTERIMYYMSESVVTSAEKGEWDYQIDTVYGIFITDFHLKHIPLQEKVMTEYAMADLENSNNLLTQKIRVFVIDLDMFHMNEKDLRTDLDKWIFSIKNMGTMTAVPKLAEENTFDRLYSRAEIAGMNEDELYWYKRELRNKWDRYAIEKAKKKRDKESDEKAENAERAMKEAEEATKEAERATKEAEKATKEAEKAKKEAERATKEAEKAKKEAEEATKEAEEATKEAEEATKEAERATKEAEKAKKEAEEATKKAEDTTKKAEDTTKEIERLKKEATEKGAINVIQKLLAQGLLTEEQAADMLQISIDDIHALKEQV